MKNTFEIKIQELVDELNTQIVIKKIKQSEIIEATGLTKPTIINFLKHKKALFGTANKISQFINEYKLEEAERGCE